MSQQIQFNPERCQLDEMGKTITCPCCNHLVVLGFPHPDFDSQHLPIPEKELYNLSMEAKLNKQN